MTTQTPVRSTIPPTLNKEQKDKELEPPKRWRCYAILDKTKGACFGCSFVTIAHVFPEVMLRAEQNGKVIVDFFPEYSKEVAETQSSKASNTLRSICSKAQATSFSFEPVLTT